MFTQPGNLLFGGTLLLPPNVKALLASTLVLDKQFFNAKQI